MSASRKTTYSPRTYDAPGDQRVAFAFVRVVADDADDVGKLARNARRVQVRVVAAPVVDQDEFELVGEAFERVDDFAQVPVDVLRLVERRHQNRNFAVIFMRSALRGFPAGS